METVINAIVFIVGLSIINVWLLRFGKSTPWRGGKAQNMKEEFQAYGLPGWFMWVVGFIKVTLAVLLIISVWYEPLQVPSALGIGLLMLGAVIMHVKIKDPFIKSLPALIFLFLTALVVGWNVW